MGPQRAPGDSPDAGAPASTADHAGASVTETISARRGVRRDTGDRLRLRTEPDGGETSDHQDQLRRLAEDFVSTATDEARQIDPKLAVEPLVVGLRPVDALIETATEREARVIVVGSMGEIPTLGATLGSVPHKLLHHSKIPVLVVPHPD